MLTQVGAGALVGTVAGSGLMAPLAGLFGSAGGVVRTGQPELPLRELSSLVLPLPAFGAGLGVSAAEALGGGGALDTGVPASA